MTRRPHDPSAQRREPTIGDLADVRVEGRTGIPRSPGSDIDRRWRVGLIAAFGLLLLLVIVFSGFLADVLMPKTRAHDLVERGAQALAAGHLTASDGSGARELYEAAIAIDPDRPEARAGLARVADAALQVARDAAAQDRFADAHAALKLARELSVPRGAADEVAARLREREAAHAGIDGLVQRAEEARLAGRFVGDDAAALPLFARVLTLQPAHAEALRGREDAIGSLLDDARERLRTGDVAAAARNIEIAQQYDAGHVDLPDTQARLTEELETLRRRAEVNLERGRIDAAVDVWRSLLARDPEDAGAQAGLARAADAYAARARRHAADFRFADADSAMKAALALAPGSDSVRAAAAQVERSRRTHRESGVALPAAERRRRVATLLQQANEAEARGDLLTPPGASAYDALRAAQSLAPGDAAVRQAAARLLPMAKRCFEAGLSANDLGRARDCLDMRAALGEDGADVVQARRRLASRWLAIGDERLAAGQIEGARAALHSARSNDPATPGLTQLDSRLRAASPASE